MPAILIVDDERSVRTSLATLLRGQNYHVETAANGREAMRLLNERPFDLMVTDLKMSGMDGLELIRNARKICPALEVVVLTAYGTVESAVEAIKRGAFDYIAKPVEPEKLLVIIRNALEKESLKGELSFLRRELKKKASLKNLIGRSKGIRDVIETVKKVAPTDSTVLITGETGTGKQLIAYALYSLSDRSDRTFVEVNCNALSEELIESELFGHVKGAFTGAVEAKKGLFEVANRGTIFFDEIGATSLRFQTKLLKMIEDKTIKMVGSNESIKVDARIIAATNRYLPSLVERGEFRKDLYFRLNVVSIFLPPLHDREEDILLLGKHFVDIYSRKHGKDITKISRRAQRLLNEYPWPGNVRELEHVIERAVIFSKGSDLRECDFPFFSEQAMQEHAQEGAAGQHLTLMELEKTHIKRVLEKYLGNRSFCAKELGIGRNTLIGKIRKYGLGT